MNEIIILSTNKHKKMVKMINEYLKDNPSARLIAVTHAYSYKIFAYIEIEVI